MSPQSSDFTPADQAFVGEIVKRLKQAFAPDGNGVKLTDAGQFQLSKFFGELVLPRQREVAISALVQTAYVMQSTLGSDETSKRLLAIANGMLPKA